MNHMGLAFLDITGAAIAKYMPFYTVSFIWSKRIEAVYTLYQCLIINPY